MLKTPSPRSPCKLGLGIRSQSREHMRLSLPPKECPSSLVEHLLQYSWQRNQDCPMTMIGKTTSTILLQTSTTICKPWNSFLHWCSLDLLWHIWIGAHKVQNQCWLQKVAILFISDLSYGDVLYIHLIEHTMEGCFKKYIRSKTLGFRIPTVI